MKPPYGKAFPFCLEVDHIGGETIQETCASAVHLSRHLRCIIKIVIKDIELTVIGAVMTPESVYEKWEAEYTARYEQSEFLVA